MSKKDFIEKIRYKLRSYDAGNSSLRGTIDYVLAIAYIYENQGKPKPKKEPR